jgi:hypothetical protein
MPRAENLIRPLISAAIDAGKYPCSGAGPATIVSLAPVFSVLVPSGGVSGFTMNMMIMVLFL